MPKKFIPYSLPEIGDEEIAAVTDTLRSGWITTGPRTREFEDKFRNYIDESTETIAVNSATSGLHLALEAFGIGPGDEVITTILTFTATAEVVRYLGADVSFVDIDPVTLNMNIELLENTITEKTKAIIPVHYGGLPCDMDLILSVARKHNICVIEDAAHALPSRYKGKLIGSLDSDATVFSFYANKTITTGEGGMVVTKNKEAAKRMRIMRLHGIDRDAFNRFQSKVPAWYYEVIAPGFKYNMTDIAASIGIHQLDKVDEFRKRREKQALKYLEQLKSLPLVLPSRGDIGETHSWHLYVIRLDNASIDRDELINKLSEDGIGTSVHYVPLYRHPYWRDRYQLSPELFPQTEKAYQSMLSIPLYSSLSDEDHQFVISSLQKILS